jgi:hypothetical protein
MTRIFSILVLGVAALAGCDDGGGDVAADDSTGGEATGGHEDTAHEDSEGEPMVDEDAVAAQALGYKSFERVNAEPLPSEHALGDTVNFWIPADVVTMYENHGADDLAFAPGTLLVKEHLDAEGGYTGLTVMFKAPEGYNPEAADWYWARITPADEVADSGKVAFCIGCHTRAAETDFVFGL